MKKIIFIVFITAVCCLSCSTDKTLFPKASETTCSTYDTETTTSFSMSEDMHFDIYDLEISEEYNCFISTNIIDQAYLNHYPETGVTSDMREYEAKFADIWKNEMEYSIQNLSHLLNDTDKEMLANLQENWLTWIESNLAFNYTVLANEEYGSNLGSLLPVSQRATYKNAYRKRTLEIKYIHFLLEKQMDPAKSVTDSDALRFKFTGISDG